MLNKSILYFFLLYCFVLCGDLRLYYWNNGHFTNFGDYLSVKLVERIIEKKIEIARPNAKRKLLAIGSIMRLARDGDIVWGTGVSGKSLEKKKYQFKNLDVRAVRGPLTRAFLINNFHIDCPEVYGDPALLFPYFFPEFKKNPNPIYEYIIIPHYSEMHLFPKNVFSNVINPTANWKDVIEAICNSKFVISSSLHGLIIAESFGIPARLLKVTNNEPLFKYKDYYYGTGRYNFRAATSVEEALKLKGEAPYSCNLQKLLDCFPYEHWNVNKIEMDIEN